MDDHVVEALVGNLEWLLRIVLQLASGLILVEAYEFQQLLRG